MTKISNLHFEDLSSSSNYLFEKKYIEDNPYADTSHATLLYWWCLEQNAQIAVHNDNLCIQSTYPLENGELSISLFGVNNINDSLADIFSYQKQKNLPLGIHFTPAYTVEAIKDKANLRIEENRDIAEYVMSIQEHAFLEGANFKRLRNKVSHFNKLSFAPKIEFSSYLIDKDNIERTKFAIKKINASQKNDREKIEDIAIEKLLNLSNDFPITCYMLRHDTKVIAVGLVKEIASNTLNFCHIRYSSDYPDLFTYFFHLTCRYIHDNAKSYTQINIEQDLGIDGMRQHKLRMRPVTLLKKYSVYPIDTTLY